MIGDEQRDVFWQRVFFLVEALEAEGTSEEECKHHIMAIEEGFSGAVDPVDDFPEFLAVRLCKALRSR